jgi:hypothetical protein
MRSRPPKCVIAAGRDEAFPLRAGDKSMCVLRNAGTRPKRTPAPIETNTVNARTRQSGPTMKGNGPSASRWSAAVKAGVPQMARIDPSAQTLNCFVCSVAIAHEHAELVRESQDLELK